MNYSGESGLASFGLYDVTVTIGSYTVLVNVGITEEGEIVLRSWGRFFNEWLEQSARYQESLRDYGLIMWLSAF